MNFVITQHLTAPKVPFHLFCNSGASAVFFNKFHFPNTYRVKKTDITPCRVFEILEFLEATKVQNTLHHQMSRNIYIELCTLYSYTHKEIIL